jgi:hypothetical protein
MDELDQYSPSNPFATEEHRAQTQWDAMQPAPDVGDHTNTNGHTMLAEAETAHALDSLPEATEVTSGDADAIERARSIAQELVGSLTRLTTALDDTAAERDRLVQQSAELQEKIRSLEGVRDSRDKLIATLRQGPGGSLTDEDLQSIQAMMDALKQDPDRLTVLFTVVQNAANLASLINDYTQVRRLADSL